MSKWMKFPHDQKAITYAGDALKKNWDALHKGDNEPFPKDAGMQEAWRQFHAGNFAVAAAQAALDGASISTQPPKSLSLPKA